MGSDPVIDGMFQRVIRENNELDDRRRYSERRKRWLKLSPEAAERWDREKAGTFEVMLREMISRAVQ